MQNETISLENYLDYRAFLNDYHQLKKKLKPRWSLGSWSKNLGLKSTSSLTKILNGEREPGTQITSALCDYFKFSAKEKNYFQDLIRLSKLNSDPRLKATLMQDMSKLAPSKIIRILDDRSFDLIKNWYSYTIREMVRLKDFKEDADWICSRVNFPLTPNQVRSTIEVLIHQGLLKRDQNGKLDLDEETFQTTNDIPSKALKDYHAEMLECAKKSLYRDDVMKREFNAETLTISKDKMPVAKELIRKFKRQFFELMEVPTGDETYQLQIQFFPLTKENPK